MAKLGILLACLLPIAGCGVLGTRSAGGASEQVETDTANGNSGASPEVVVIPAADALPVDGFGMPGRQSGDRFADPTADDSVDHLLDPILISFFLDDLVLELLDPTGPRREDSLTFLERQCRDDGFPDFICRQRYGR